MAAGQSITAAPAVELKVQMAGSANQTGHKQSDCVLVTLCLCRGEMVVSSTYDGIKLRRFRHDTTEQTVSVTACFSLAHTKNQPNPSGHQ